MRPVSSGSAGFDDFAVYQEQQASGTNGGSSVATTWTTRILNTVVSSRGSSMSLNTGTGVITLQPGYRYLFDAFSDYYMVGRVRSRIYNVTAGSAALFGIVSLTNATTSTSIVIPISGVVDLRAAGVANTLTLDYYCMAVRATDGLGYAMNTGDVEVFSQVSIKRLL